MALYILSSPGPRRPAGSMELLSEFKDREHDLARTQFQPPWHYGLRGGFGSPPHPQTSMRAAGTSAKSMAQDLGYMLVARGGLTKLGVVSTKKQGPILDHPAPSLLHERSIEPEKLKYEPHAFSQFRKPHSSAPRCHHGAVSTRPELCARPAPVQPAGPPTSLIPPSIPKDP